MGLWSDYRLDREKAGRPKNRGNGRVTHKPNPNKKKTKKKKNPNPKNTKNKKHPPQQNKKKTQNKQTVEKKFRKNPAGKILRSLKTINQFQPWDRWVVEKFSIKSAKPRPRVQPMEKNCKTEAWKGRSAREVGGGGAEKYYPLLAGAGVKKKSKYARERWGC